MEEQNVLSPSALGLSPHSLPVGRDHDGGTDHVGHQLTQLWALP